MPILMNPYIMCWNCTFILYINDKKIFSMNLNPNLKKLNYKTVCKSRSGSKGGLCRSDSKMS